MGAICGIREGYGGGRAQYWAVMWVRRIYTVPDKASTLVVFLQHKFQQKSCYTFYSRPHPFSRNRP